MNTSTETATTIDALAEDYSFQPSVLRAEVLNQRMRSGLAQSVSYLAEQAGEALKISPPQLQKFLAAAQVAPISPQAFCLYHDLVFALEADDLETAHQLFSDLLQLPAPVGGSSVFSLPDPEKSAAGQRYARFIDADFTSSFTIHPPTLVAEASCRAQIAEAFALMDAGDPELAAEIRALVSEIILAAGTEDPKQMTFDGASAFLLWGAILINANRRDGAVGMVQMLAHESAHDLLFAFCPAGPLTENAPEERFPSPLRVDLRPMEGIYHATFVTARMHRAVRQLIVSGVLNGELLEKARQELAENARLFAKGIAVVRTHGKLSPHGAALMQGAETYMAAHA